MTQLLDIFHSHVALVAIALVAGALVNVVTVLDLHILAIMEKKKYLNSVKCIKDHIDAVVLISSMKLIDFSIFLIILDLL